MAPIGQIADRVRISMAKCENGEAKYVAWTENDSPVQIRKITWYELFQVTEYTIFRLASLAS